MSSMSPQPMTENTLYYGDNLSVLRDHIPTDSVDLLYLDPPFNSNRSYNVLFRDDAGTESEAQIEAFTDTWHWGEVAEDTYKEIVEHTQSHISELIVAMRRFVGSNQMMAYLVMMTVRLVELHRVLKPTGSIYLHCDPVAVHYLKIVMDTIFGVENYRNMIVWKRTSAHSDAKGYGDNYDTILFYTKGKTWTRNSLYVPHDEQYIARFRNADSDGRRWSDYDLSAKGLSGGGYEYEYKGVRSLWRMPLATMERLDAEGKLHFTRAGGIRLKRYLDENKGVTLQALWEDIPPINSQAAERLGYPTQKPLALLERIIQASSNPGGLVLDPFAGCGTATDAAQSLGRRWLGIDITYLSIALLKYRLAAKYPGLRYKVIGEPVDIYSARQLALDDRMQFQFWAVSLVQAFPLGGHAGSREGKKGADAGIDGTITFQEETTKKAQRILVQVKSGGVSVRDIRDLVGTVQREAAVMGAFITLESPTTPMRTEALQAGYYHSPDLNQDFPKIQILTVGDLLHGTATLRRPLTFAPMQGRRGLQRSQHPEAYQSGQASFVDVDD